MTRIAATAALALLTLGAVFAVTAGQREDLATRTAALRQTLAATSPLTQSIAVSAPWTGMSSALSSGRSGNGEAQLLSGNQLAEIASQLRGHFNQGLVHLAPPAGDLLMLTTPVLPVRSNLAATQYPVRLEVSYRQPFSNNMRLVAGRFPGPVPPASVPAPPSPYGLVQGEPVPRFYAPRVQVVVTSQTAATLGLHPGSKVVVGPPEGAFNGVSRSVTLEVTGIVAPRDPSATSWTADATVLKPELEQFGPLVNIWYGGVIAGPSELAAIQQDWGPDGLTVQWLLPLSAGSPGGDQARPLQAALNRLGNLAVPLTGDVAPVAPDLTTTSNLLPVLKSFLATEQAVDTLLWLLYVSLAAACLVVFLLTARMIALRRSAELAIRRARGASLRQIAATTALGTALACVPAAVVGAGLAVLFVPGPVPAGGWWGPAAVLTAAVCAPPVAAVWQQRLPLRQPRQRHRARGWGRLVAEVTAIAASVAGLVVFRQQGIQAGTGVNLYTSAAPVLIAVPAVIVVLRVYPLALRAALRGTSRRAGAPAFLGLARAARTRLTPALPAFALVLTLSVAAFAGMVQNAVSSGDVRASWQAAGADATVIASFLNITSATIDPAALRAAAGARGVTHSAALWKATWTTPDGQQLTGLVVDPANYAALVAATQTFPRVPAGLLKAAPAGTPQPVLASPQAATDMGSGVTTLTSGADVSPVRVRVAGVLSGTPALPGGGAFVIIPLSAMHSTATPPVPVGFNELLLSGADIDKARVAAVVRDMIGPFGSVTFRSDILNGLTTAPLQHGTFFLTALALAVAVGLGLAVMLLELTLGAAEREETLARLATMGLSEGQRARVVALEVLPAVAAAAVAAWACAVALPQVVGPAIDLTVFTGSSAAVVLRPDAAAVGWPLLVLVAVAFAALAVEIRGGRRRGAAASLRAGG